MADLVTAEQLALFAPHCPNPELTAQVLSENMGPCEITTPRRIRHFMAHLYVESAGFTVLEENLNYSVGRLQAVWPTRFPTPASAQPYARNPRALAQKVYGGRMGNNTQLDGWNYRGSGYIMLTGKDNFTAASTWTGLDLVTYPDMAREPHTAAKIACRFWQTHNLNIIADRDPEEVVVKTLAEQVRVNEVDNVERETAGINGGLNGIDQRIAQVHRSIQIWT